jgi:RNA polymerase sigma factor (sigma-70 family)
VQRKFHGCRLCGAPVAKEGVRCRDCCIKQRCEQEKQKRKAAEIRTQEERNRLVMENRGLPYYVVHEQLTWRQIRKLGGYDEANQIANLAFLRAAEQWVEERGAFTTYCCRCIHGSLQNHIHQSGLIRKPQYLQAGMKKGPASLSRLFRADQSKKAECIEPPTTELNHTILTENQELVARAFECLEEIEREVLIAYYWEGKTLAEISEERGYSRGWTPWLINRILKKIRRELNITVGESV